MLPNQMSRIDNSIHSTFRKVVVPWWPKLNISHRTWCDPSNQMSWIEEPIHSTYREIAGPLWPKLKHPWFISLHTLCWSYINDTFIQFYPNFFLEIWILSFNPAHYNFIPDPSPEMEFYPLIPTKIEFHPFIRKERYPLTLVQCGHFSRNLLSAEV